MSTTAPVLARPIVSDRALARTQAASGIVFASFLVLHLATALSAIAGQAAYDATLAAMRHYYQLVVVEVALVIGASLVHIGAGVVRMWRRRGQRALPIPLRLRLHRYAGYYLMAAYTGHVIATRLAPLAFGVTPDFTFLHYSLTSAGYFFYPYYALLAL
ncbi:MAG: hypothetical protein K8H88_25050, partial [Sandaracinaceae bacterium]|nr:hypothetical protein [Sandaracinaceae bacterium]